MNPGELKQLVTATLEPLGVPVGYQTDISSGEPYFSFFILSDSGAAWADGETIAFRFHIQLDGWSRGDMDDLCYRARQLLCTAGFRYVLGRELYEPDTGIHHRVQQFSYTKEE